MFWLDLLKDPVKTLDLVDARGENDHGKILTVLVMVALVVGHFTGTPFSLGMAIVLISAAFGRQAWVKFLDSRTVQARESLERRETTVTVQAPPRDFGEMMQPTVD